MTICTASETKNSQPQEIKWYLFLLLLDSGSYINVGPHYLTMDEQLSQLMNISIFLGLVLCGSTDSLSVLKLFLLVQNLINNFQVYNWKIQSLNVRFYIAKLVVQCFVSMNSSKVKRLARQTSPVHLLPTLSSAKTRWQHCIYVSISLGAFLQLPEFSIDIHIHVNLWHLILLPFHTIKQIKAEPKYILH